MWSVEFGILRGLGDTECVEVDVNLDTFWYWGRCVGIGFFFLELDAEIHIDRAVACVGMA